MTQEMAKIDAQIATARAEGARRIAEAQTRKGALIAESKGQTLCEKRWCSPAATAEVAVQRARIAQVRYQLVADKIKPAEAKKAQMVAQARGAASKIIEDGKATASAIRALGQTWGKAGDSARQIFVAQKLSGLVNTMMSTVGETPIDKLTIIDKELAGNGGNFAIKAAVTAEQIKQMLGVDLAAMAQNLGQRTLPAPPLMAATLPAPPPPPMAPPVRSKPPTIPGK